MTTFAVPPAGSPAWQEIYPVPPVLRLETVGPWCPLDDSRLQVRTDGWGCTSCQAGWDFYGESARWLAESKAVVVAPVRWRPSPVKVLAGLVGLAGCAAAAVALAAVLGELDGRLLWWLIAAIAATAVLYVAAGWLSGRIADWPYRHNRVTAVYNSVEQAQAYTRLEQTLGAPEVPDEH